MALRTQDLIEWFTEEARSTSVDISFSMNVLPEGQPNRSCAIRKSGGLGLELEGVLDKPTFELIVRGVNHRDAEALALALDGIWLDAPSTFYIGPTLVKGKERFGGEPTFFQEDPSEQFPERMVYRCGPYWARIARV